MVRKSGIDSPRSIAERGTDLGLEAGAAGGTGGGLTPGAGDAEEARRRGWRGGGTADKPGGVANHGPEPLAAEEIGTLMLRGGGRSCCC